ncbi:MAG: metal-dependent hydrolase [Planctomycetota bacterium]
MNTPSHWLMTISVGKIGPWKQNCPKWALGLGSIAPDIPLYFLSFGGIAYFGWWLGWDMKTVERHLFANLYYHDPAWISLHNILHSPTMIGLILLLIFPLQKTFPSACRWLKFFLFACLMHSLVDVVTHFDDGPVLFFPFNWNYRFSSPVSYWDPAHHGRIFMVFEVLLDLLLAFWLIYRRQNVQKPKIEEVS